MHRPPDQQAVAAAAVMRGPLLSDHVPNTLVPIPSVRAAKEKIGTTLPSSQSDAAGATTPSVRHNGALNEDQAYTAPIEVVTKIPPGTACHRLKPLGAAERERSKNPTPEFTSSSFSVFCCVKVACCRRINERRCVDRVVRNGVAVAAGAQGCNTNASNNRGRWRIDADNVLNIGSAVTVTRVRLEEVGHNLSFLTRSFRFQFTLLYRKRRRGPR